MYKEGVLNVVPILYFIIPIILGLITGFIIKKFTFRKIVIYSLIIPICLSIISLINLSFIFNSTNSEVQLLSILFILNSIIILLSNTIYLFLYRLYAFIKKEKLKI